GVTVNLRRPPLAGVVAERAPPGAGIDIDTAQLVGLDRRQEPLGVDLALEALASLASVVGAPPSLPIALPSSNARHRSPPCSPRAVACTHLTCRPLARRAERSRAAAGSFAGRA